MRKDVCGMIEMHSIKLMEAKSGTRTFDVLHLYVLFIVTYLFS